MKYLSLFSGCGIGEKGIEEAYASYFESTSIGTESEPEERSQGRERSADKRRVLLRTGSECAPLRDRESENLPTAERQQSGRNLRTRPRPSDEQIVLRPQRPDCIGYAEIDKYASAVYRRHFPEHRNLGDAARIVSDNALPGALPDFDFLIAGFPCQAFSIAGKRRGFDEARGTLFFEIARILSHKRPAHFLLENVKGLLSHETGSTVQRILAILAGLDYFVEVVVLNSKDYGVPQNRERVFFIGHLDGGCTGEILSVGCRRETDFELQGQSGITNTLVARYGTSYGNGSYVTERQFDEKEMIQIGEGKQGSRVYDAEGLAATVTAPATGGTKNNFYAVGVNVPSRGAEPRKDGNACAIKAGESGTKNVIAVGTLRTHKDGEGFREMKEGVSPALNARARQDGSQQPVIAVLTPDRATKRQNGRRFKEDGEPAFTLTGQDQHGVSDGKSIRRLTPIECERLQGMPDNWTEFGLFDGELIEISDTQRYKMLGNGFTENVIEAIIREMLNNGCLNDNK